VLWSAQLIVQTTLRQADLDKDGVISAAEFGHVLGEQVVNTLTVKHLVPKPKVRYTLPFPFRSVPSFRIAIVRLFAVWS
jgi:hypothetical protein